MKSHHIFMMAVGEDLDLDCEILQFLLILDVHLFQGSEDPRLFVTSLEHRKGSGTWVTGRVIGVNG